MSTASCQRTIKYIKSSGTFMCSMTTNQGDLFQTYVDETAATWKPSWNSLSDSAKPMIQFVCMSSRVSEGEADIDFAQMQWFFNDDEIKFSTTNSAGTNEEPVYAATGTYAGYFSKTRIAVDKDKGLYRMALRIDNDLVALGGYAPINIKGVATIITGEFSDQVQSTYQIGISKLSGTTYKATIVPGDVYNFVINQKTGNGSSVILKAKLYCDGVEDTTSTKTYEWYKLTDNNTWTLISGATTDTITVTESDVSTYQVYMVKIFADNQERGQDTQGVTDVTDPYILSPNPTPTSEQIISGSGGTVVYAPIIMTRGGAVVYTDPTNKKSLFDFITMDAAGARHTTAEDVSTFTVTEDICSALGGDVSLIITSNEF